MREVLGLGHINFESIAKFFGSLLKSLKLHSTLKFIIKHVDQNTFEWMQFRLTAMFVQLAMTRISRTHVLLTNM